METVTQPAAWLNEAMNVNGEWTWPGQWVSLPAASFPNRVTPKLEASEITTTPKYPTSSTNSAARTLSLTPTLTSAAPPTSPLKKDFSHSFKYPASSTAAELHDRRSSVIGVKLQKIGREEPTSSALFSAVISGMRSRHSSGAPVAVDTRKAIMTSPASFSEPFTTTPTNTVVTKCDISAEDREVCRLLKQKEAAATAPVAEKDSHALSQIWVQSREGTPSILPRSRPDSLLQVNPLSFSYLYLHLLTLILDYTFIHSFCWSLFHLTVRHDANIFRFCRRKWTTSAARTWRRAPRGAIKRTCTTITTG